MAETRPRICLNMIVRDESHVIAECLESVAAYIDYWIICDTGSRDDTASIIAAFFEQKGIPGELHHHQWRDFGHNRSLALDLVSGKAEYAWVIDADDYLVGTPDFTSLTAGSYDFLYRLGDGCSYWRRQLFRMDLPWQYCGVVHEYPHCEVPAPVERLPGNFHIVARRLGGVRNRDAQKYARDVALLRNAVENDPADTRSVFYLAQSYYDHNDMPNAEKWYRRRVEMDGWAEEVFFAQMRVGLSLEAQGASDLMVCAALLDAWELRPQRAEPLCHLARISRVGKRWNQAYLYAKQAVQTPLPQADLLFVDESVWLWRALDELSIAAYWTGRFEESRDLCEQLLHSGRLPEEQRPRVQENLDFAVSRRSAPV